MNDLTDDALPSVLSRTDYLANTVGGATAAESGKRLPRIFLRVPTDDGVHPYLRALILAHPLFKPKADCLNKAAFA